MPALRASASPLQALQALPATTRDDVALMGAEAQAKLASLVAAVDAQLLGDIVDAIAEPTLWCVPMRPADEARVLAAAINAVPVASVRAKRGVPAADDIAIVDVKTNGTDAVAGDIDGAFALVEAAWRSSSAVVMAPEWLFVPASGVALSRADKDALVARLAALTAGSDRLLVPGTIPWADGDGGYHNTAMAFSNGQVVHSVDKRGDGDDVGIANGAGLSFVSNPGHSTFRWRGLSVGLEVCRDHGDARLRYELLASGKGTVDLQLVVSSGVWLKHAAVAVGGVVAVAQGDGIAGAEVATRADDGSLHFAGDP
jgi:hypothetical protein